MGGKQAFEVSTILSMEHKDELYHPTSMRSQQALRHSDSPPICMTGIESEEGCIKLALNIEGRVNLG